MTQREKRPPTPFGKAGGFTALEIIVTVVVLSILSAYAVPKLFGLKDQADEAEETLKIQDIASKHAKEMLEQGKRNGSLPTLGGTVGYRPEVVSEPAPATAPLLVDYSFAFFSETPTSTPEGGWIGIHPGVGPDSRTDAFDYPAADEQMLCDGAQIWSRFKGTGDPTSYYIPVSPNVLQARGFEASIVSGGPSSGALPTDEIPKCRAIYRSIRVTNISATQTATYLAALRARPGHVEWISPTGRLFHYSALTLVMEDWTLRSMSDAPAPGAARVRDILPQKWRATCSAHVQRYGAPYVLRGLVNGWNSTLPTHFGGTGIRSMAGDNGKEKSHWGSVEGTNLRVLQESPLISAIDGRPLTEILGGAYCERVGEAPVPPPADSGNPGAYPMASDWSGYCLGKGRKLPTYKDGNGTPTASATDPVAELATEAVDDPTNCP